MAGYRKRKLDREDFLSDIVTAFEERIHTDVIVKPGDGGPGIPAHKAVLAVRSKVFSYMLDSDEFKTSIEGSITIPDLSYEELKTLLKFFYDGFLSFTTKHIRALYLAADKYDIEYLQDICREQLTYSLTVSNVLDILMLSSIPSDKLLMTSAIDFIVIHMKEIVNSSKYKAFVRGNPDLSLEITKAYITYKGKRY
ncbi:PREDICTED: BTB/POZ domain-containing protein At1g01640-like [Camelina sativa]|uniref:BTB/POZ domain-containing protein At1g01640-like n=1 Tax=Camelina sativa TaxID=90675 RepID=A0ABM0XFF0_CAMSA|nr:PREDICTED: BTB/POZ domain-containing protein At1g01640-like [Camelina sativa]